MICAVLSKRAFRHHHPGAALQCASKAALQTVFHLLAVREVIHEGTVADYRPLGQTQHATPVAFNIPPLDAEPVQDRVVPLHTAPGILTVDTADVRSPIPLVPPEFARLPLEARV